MHIHVCKDVGKVFRQSSVRIIEVWIIEVSLYTQFVASKHVAACNEWVQQSGCGLTIRSMPGIYEHNPDNYLNENILCTGNCSWPQRTSRNSYATHTKKERSPEAEQLFGMYDIHMHHIVFDLCMTRNKRTVEISHLVLSALKMVSGTYRVNLLKEQERDVLYIVSNLCICPVCFSQSCSYTLCTGGHFEPDPSLLKKYYHTSCLSPSQCNSY